MGISWPFARKIAQSVAYRMKATLEKVQNRAKLLFKRGSQQSPFLYFGAFFIVFFVILTITLGLSAKYPRHGDKTLILAAVSESANQASPAPFFGARKGVLAASPELLLVGNASILGFSSPSTITSQTLGAIFLNVEPEDQKKIITEHIVQAGDTISSLASKFEISTETLLWANGLHRGVSLKIGEKLVIPPVSGVIHHVKDNDTISSIAEKYKAKAEQIIVFNELTPEGAIYTGDILVIPGGKMPSVKLSQSSLTPLGDSYFICPTASCKRSQGLHWYNAIDFSGNCGDQVRAAAQGQVLKVALTSSASRYAFGGAGNHLAILHPNGVVTTYGHILTSLVSQGQQVSQGQAIALIGGQPGSAGSGYSTGCHVHFGVTGARNPFAR